MGWVLEEEEERRRKWSRDEEKVVVGVKGEGKPKPRDGWIQRKQGKVWSVWLGLAGSGLVRSMRRGDMEAGRGEKARAGAELD